MFDCTVCVFTINIRIVCIRNLKIGRQIFSNWIIHKFTTDDKQQQRTFTDRWKYVPLFFSPRFYYKHAFAGYKNGYFMIYPPLLLHSIQCVFVCFVIWEEIKNISPPPPFVKLSVCSKNMERESRRFIVSNKLIKCFVIVSVSNTLPLRIFLLSVKMP